MALKHISQVVTETEDYIDKRRKGLIKSCKTGFKRLDKALLGGIEWGSVLSIGGRPSVGKTAFSSCLLRGILMNNPIDEIEIIDFNWEMSAQALIIRDLSSAMKETYGDVISADDDKRVSDARYKEYLEVLAGYKKYPWWFEEEPKSTREFEDIIKKRKASDPKKKRIYRIDHSILAKQAADEASQVTMLQNLLNVCVRQKKTGNDIYMVLTQLGREFETRQENATDSAFPKRSDPFGGDAVAQSSEIVLLLNRPSTYGVTMYGNRPGGKIVEDDDLFVHLVKNRNAQGDLIFHFKQNFKNMSVKEF